MYNACEDVGPYSEKDAKPGRVYASHKLEMEQRVLDILPSAVMLRAEWMYDYYAQRPNYFMNILNAKNSVSFSKKQFRGITYLKEAAQNMQKVIELPGGSYNFGSETTLSMYEVTKIFTDLLGKNIMLEDEAVRHNLWMNCEKARQYGVEFSSVIDGLKKCAKDYNLL